MYLVGCSTIPWSWRCVYLHLLTQDNVTVCQIVGVYIKLILEKEDLISETSKILVKLMDRKETTENMPSTDRVPHTLSESVSKVSTL